MKLTVLWVALAAPALPFAAQSPLMRGGRAASAASAEMPDDASSLPEMGVTQVPARGNTQVPDTPVTPRPHNARPPAHLP
ncbi:hypothetical protein [Caballeronia sp. GAWG2-1]|uniref:hypothetical protein n=1 Tax=Caballeronia sp. GAWG2-1 TaxID=2921744 RepID=UPI002027803E|nr:hypothetical protein [Caballeronia sp. GAWG2-1]